MGVSTHAPARGATKAAKPVICFKRSFNPRTRTGCDHRGEEYTFPQTSFNPRTRTGCDKCWTSSVSLVSRFQPTHPHGVRHSGLGYGFMEVCFNPRTRTGCDFEESRDAITLLSFNPRTRTGCDCSMCAFAACQICVSTHAPARGATTEEHRELAEVLFQPTHPHGVRR